MSTQELPPHYRACIRTLLRFAAVMAVIGLLSGVLFQESSKKLDHSVLPPGTYLLSSLRLALVHGHVIVTAVLIPIACGGALLLARKVGAEELGPKPLQWLTRGYLPCLAVALALMLVKAYHVLLAVRGGNTDFDAIDERFFFGQHLVRAVVYGGAHTFMAVSLGVFMVALWRSLKRL